MPLQTFPWSDLLSINAQWKLREEPVEACADRLGQMLRALETLHDGFPLLMWTGGPMRPLYPVPARIDELVSMFRPERIYDEARRCRLPDGFVFTADARLGGKRFIQLHIRAGGHVECDEQVAQPNYVSIGTVIYDPDGEDRAIVAAMNPALEAVVAAWKPDRAAAFSRNSAAQTHDPAHRCFYNGARHIYLNPQQAERIAAPRGAARASLCAGGCLVPTENADDVGSSKCVLDALLQGPTAAAS
jgi:hypothetical protein